VVACPQSAREAVIWETHSMIHSGVRKTTARLRLSWYWPGMTSDIKRAVLSCEVCQGALLLNQCAHEDDWDMLLPQIMRAIRATPHTANRKEWTGVSAA